MAGSARCLGSDMPIARLYVAACTDCGDHCPTAADTAAEARIAAQTLHRWETTGSGGKLVDQYAHCAGNEESDCERCAS